MFVRSPDARQHRHKPDPCEKPPIFEVNMPPNIPGQIDLSGPKALLKSQLNSIIEESQAIKQDFFSLRRRYQKLPAETKDNPALLPGQCRTLCAVELGNNPWASFPRIIASLKEAVCVAQGSIEEGKLDGARCGLESARVHFRNAKNVGTELKEAVEAHEQVAGT